MSDYRTIEIIVNAIGEDNIMTDEKAKMLCAWIEVDVFECVTTEEVMEEIEKRILAIEDDL